jgi:hypothetical protein
MRGRRPEAVEHTAAGTTVQRHEQIEDRQAFAAAGVRAPDVGLALHPLVTEPARSGSSTPPQDAPWRCAGGRRRRRGRRRPGRGQSPRAATGAATWPPAGRPAVDRLAVRSSTVTNRRPPAPARQWYCRTPAGGGPSAKAPAPALTQRSRDLVRRPCLRLGCAPCVGPGWRRRVKGKQHHVRYPRGSGGPACPLARTIGPGGPGRYAASRLGLGGECLPPRAPDGAPLARARVVAPGPARAARPADPGPEQGGGACIRGAPQRRTAPGRSAPGAGGAGPQRRGPGRRPGGAPPRAQTVSVPRSRSESHCLLPTAGPPAGRGPLNLTSPAEEFSPTDCPADRLCRVGSGSSRRAAVRRPRLRSPRSRSLDAGLLEPTPAPAGREPVTRAWPGAGVGRGPRPAPGRVPPPSSSLHHLGHRRAVPRLLGLYLDRARGGGRRLLGLARLFSGDAGPCPLGRQHGATTSVLGADVGDVVPDSSQRHTNPAARPRPSRRGW